MYEWKPAKSILPQGKPATHEKFQARKKQQQQAEANEDPEDWNSIPIFDSEQILCYEYFHYLFSIVNDFQNLL